MGNGTWLSDCLSINQSIHWSCLLSFRPPAKPGVESGQSYLSYIGKIWISVRLCQTFRVTSCWKWNVVNVSFTKQNKCLCIKVVYSLPFQGILGNVWRHFWRPLKGSSTGHRPELLISILPYTRQTSQQTIFQSKMSKVPNLRNADITWIKIYSKPNKIDFADLLLCLSIHVNNCLSHSR